MHKFCSNEKKNQLFHNYIEGAVTVERYASLISLR